MLLNLHKKGWQSGLYLEDFGSHEKSNNDIVNEMLELAKGYKAAVEDEDKLTKEELAIAHVGKRDPKRHLSAKVDVLMASNITQCLGAMLGTVVFS